MSRLLADIHQGFRKLLRDGLILLLVALMTLGQLAISGTLDPTSSNLAFLTVIMRPPIVLGEVRYDLMRPCS